MQPVLNPCARGKQVFQMTPIGALNLILACGKVAKEEVMGNLTEINK